MSIKKSNDYYPGAISIEDNISKMPVAYDRWGDENTAAEYLKVKPSTLRRRRSELGHNTNEVWSKNHGRVLYDLWATDKKIEGI